MNYLKKALKEVFSEPLYLFLAVSLGVNLLAFYYFIFRQSTTFAVFFSSNNAFYNWSAITLTIINAAFFGIALSLIAFILKKRMIGAASGAGNSFFGAFFGAISSGCPVCGAWLLPILGIAGSLAAFPLQGLEIKLLSVFLLSFSINESAKSIAGLCPAPKKRLLSWDEKHFTLKFNKESLSQLKPAFVILTSLLIVYSLPHLPQKYKISFANKNSPLAISSLTKTSDKGIDTQALFAQVNPQEGYSINAKYGDLGPKLVKSGAIDLEKFKSIYERSDSPLTEEQLKILTESLDKEITINQENSYFLLNFFWALGLANKNPLLEEGPITQYGENQVNSFASTGGWTLGAKEVMDIYSKSKIITLTEEQQKKVEEVANNSYRPCCGNPTSFPDCNHGMALLAVLELLAANNASVEEMYETSKYFNAFWFPQNYLDIATYFKAKEGKDFQDVEPKLVVSSEFSSGQGWSKTKKWLADNNLIEQAPQSGGGCGV